MLDDLLERLADRAISMCHSWRGGAVALAIHQLLIAYVAGRIVDLRRDPPFPQPLLQMHRVLSVFCGRCCGHVNSHNAS